MFCEYHKYWNNYDYFAGDASQLSVGGNCVRCQGDSKSWLSPCPRCGKSIQTDLMGKPVYEIRTDNVIG